MGVCRKYDRGDFLNKKILIIRGSARKNSKTAKMAEAFALGAEGKGHKVFWFYPVRDRVGPCLACDKCWSKGEACAVDPVFNRLASLLEMCDVLLISTPLYWFGFPSCVKAAIDKLYAYVGTDVLRPLAVKESYLFVCGHDPDPAKYQSIEQIYQSSMAYLGIKDRGILQTGGLSAEGALERSGVLQKAEKMGEQV